MFAKQVLSIKMRFQIISIINNMKKKNHWKASFWLLYWKSGFYMRFDFKGIFSNIVCLFFLWSIILCLSLVVCWLGKACGAFWNDCIYRFKMLTKLRQCKLFEFCQSDFQKLFLLFHRTSKTLSFKIDSIENECHRIKR